MSRIVTLLSPSGPAAPPEPTAPLDLDPEFFMDPATGTFFDGVAVAADNEPIDEVRNQGTLSTQHFLQAGGTALCPILRTGANGINNLPAFEADGLAKFFDALFSPDSTPYTGDEMSFIGVFRRTTQNNQARLACVMQSAASADFDANGSAIFAYEDTALNTLNVYRNGATNDIPHPGDDVNFILSCIFTGAEARIYKNGGAPQTAASAVAFNTLIFRIGCGANSGGTPLFFYNGKFAKQFLKFSALSAAHHNLVGEAFGADYNIVWQEVA